MRRRYRAASCRRRRAVTLRVTVDERPYDPIFGYGLNATSRPVFQRPFPGSGNLVIFQPIRAGSYVAAKLHVPETLGPNDHGAWYDAENYPGKTRTLLGKTCGDFAPADPKCVHANTTTGGGILGWGLPGGPVVSACVLEPGGDYYLNIMTDDPDGSLCSAAGCQVGLTNSF